MPRAIYDGQSDELGLLRPRAILLDSEIAELTQEFTRADADLRATIRDSLRMDDFYTLLQFSQRASVFALRERNVSKVVDGLNAIAMIARERVDWRDIFMALRLLYHSAKRIGADATQLFYRAAAISEPATAELIDGFTNMSPGEEGLRAACGFEETKVDGQIGFIRASFGAYDPSLDLVTAAIEIVDLIAKDKYAGDSIEIATDLPSYWLEGTDDAALEKALKAIRACVTINAKLRSGEHRDASNQMFVVFLVETANESATRALLTLSQQKQPQSHAMLGVAAKNLFCLVIARSFVVGVESYETAESIKRFSTDLSTLLQKDFP